MLDSYVFTILPGKGLSKVIIDHRPAARSPEYEHLGLRRCIHLYIIDLNGCPQWVLLAPNEIYFVRRKRGKTSIPRLDTEEEIGANCSSRRNCARCLARKRCKICSPEHKCKAESRSQRTTSWYSAPSCSAQNFMNQSNRRAPRICKTLCYDCMGGSEVAVQSRRVPSDSRCCRRVCENRS